MVNWSDSIGSLKKTVYFQAALQQVAKERQKYSIYPPASQVFEAFRLTPFSDIKVVILGQDPYHGQGQAHGLAFSVQQGVAIPPSLYNVYQELKNDIVDFRIPDHGCLLTWAQQGVFLLNTVLTVRAGSPQSHQHVGWQKFTDEVIKIVSQQRPHVVFMLWGASARSKIALIDQSKHLILQAPHPSPLSAHRGFFGCHHFSLANKFLMQHGVTPVNWQL